MVLSCNMFFQGLSDTAFFLVQTWYFYHKKVVTWTLQHFYNKEVMMLAFLHRWGYCWKCEFDTDVKIENYNHHDGEQLLFYKKTHIKTQRKKKDVVEIFIILYYIMQETKNSNLFDKNCTQEKPQENVKCHNSTWRKLNWIRPLNLKELLTVRLWL